MPDVYDKVNVKIKPDWLKIKLHTDGEFVKVAGIVERHGLHTICDSGKCPNKSECWSRRTATFMVLGDVCTRACRFCATATGKPLPIDAGEPEMVARSIALMELKHAVVTSVTRDDLADGGAGHWSEVIRAVRAANPDTTIEVLIPDFSGRTDLLETVLAARPDIAGHNVETVERLTPIVRSRADYRTSLDVLRFIANHPVTFSSPVRSAHKGYAPSTGGEPSTVRCELIDRAPAVAGGGAGKGEGDNCRTVAKSGVMVGLGETQDEVLRTMDDLRGAGVEIITLGQYLRPTRQHIPVAEYVTPEKFEFYRQQALSRGFTHVASGPLVRSSYMAEQAIPSLKKCAG